MAYISQDDKKTVAPAIKAVMKKYGVKGTLSASGASFYINVTSSPIDFIGDYNKMRKQARRGDLYQLGQELDTYMVCSPHWIDEHHSGKAAAFLKEAFDAMKTPEWRDNSDIQSDYFDISYYRYINIGKWNKPYTLEK